MLRFHTQTAGSSLTAQQPNVNVIRTAMQALAAVLGGTQSLHCNALDEALGLPSEETAELALRTQQVIAFESGVVDTVDPLGGSYAIESLTDRIQEEAEKLIEEIDKRGGAIKAIEAGWIQSQIQDSAYRFQKGVESRDVKVIGVNTYEKAEQVPIEVFQIDPKIEREQVKRLTALKSRRAEKRVIAALDRVEQTARRDENLMPSVLEAVEAYATLGEISDRLREVFGEYKGR
jgi:methylmalonyl-CoA mutase N-terminal domain/subunit